MPETPHLPDDNPETQPSHPQIPPELPDDDRTRVQGELSRTKGMPPVDNPQPAPLSQPPQPNVRETGKALTPPRPAPTVVPSTAREVRVERPAPRVNDWLPPEPRRGGPRGNAQPRQSAPRIGLTIPVWSVGLTLMLVCAAVSCIVFAVFSLGGRMPPAAAPQFVVVTALVPTNTAFIPDSLLASPVPDQSFQSVTVPAFSLAGPTLPPVEISPTPENIAVGKAVVVDSADSGLNVRSAPGIQNERLFVADDGEPFSVVDGPTQADGFTWWKIQSPNNPARAGWAAAVYLELAPTP